MRILIDTNVLIRALIDPARLSTAAQAVIEDPENEILFSSASIWEIAIKSAIGRADFNVTPGDIVDAATASGFIELPVRHPAALIVATLPPLHRDPFDRMLVAQAMSEPARLYTTDEFLIRYSELIVCV
ncbi:MAG: type II toxin-antitoxin system VapC family toxin [Hyphomonadaceae bacterium]|nr:type II toxin-antitoxin system VapC family toxin [Hyphomonadaceae bacterium]